MSKQVKQMQMDALKKSFGETRDLVLLTITGVPATVENQIRLQLRKKNIRLHTVKNSLAARVFEELGIKGLDPFLKGPTTVAWGAGGIAELSKQIDEWVKKEKKIQPKTAVADGTPVPFDQAKKFPTRQEAIARVVMLMLSPAARVAGQLRGPASRLASQVKSVSEKPETTAPA
jgi:large subunit ribosomal protein L10